MKHMIVFDGNSILNRAFYGIRPLTTKDGLPTNAVFGFVNIIDKSISSLGTVPEYAVIAFDLPGKTFRHKASESYKANRKGMPEELAVQLPYAKETAKGMGLVLLEKEGFEADDIMGTLARVAKENDCACVLITGDRDSFQLVGDKTEVHLATTKETQIIDEKSVLEKYGVTPAQLIDVKAIMGDSSDNIAGVPGIGEKGALKLISEYGDLDKVYENIDNIKGATKDKLIAGKDSAYMSRFLSRIETHVPISEDIEEYAYNDKDIERLTELFTRLEFRQFIDRFGLTDQPTPQEEIEFVPAGFDQLAEMAKKELLYLTVSDKEVFAYGEVEGEDGGKYYKVNLSENIEDARLLFENPKCRICVWSLKELFHALADAGVAYKCDTEDLSLLGYVLSPADNGVSFDKLALMYLNKAVAQPEVWLFKDLWEIMLEKAEENRQMYLYRDVELPLANLLARMERLGFGFDKEGLEEYSQYLEEHLVQTEQEIYDITGQEFNINSPKQLGQVLFEDLKLPHYKKTKTGYSTNAEVLERLREYYPHIINPILYYRQVQKLKSTYADGLLKVISPIDGRLHTTFKQTQTLTGRLSSVEPNLQNIPVRTQMGKTLRKFFVAKEGCKLISADYSQIELRILAHLSEDETLIQAFMEDKDIHAITASQVFGVDLASVTSEMRNHAKAVNFGIIYGISAFSLAGDIGVTRAQAEAYIHSYFAKYPKVKEYLDNTVAAAKNDGYVTTLLERRRYVPELASSKVMIRSFGERVAMNTPIQGSAADIIKKAMVDTDKAFAKAGLKSRLILQIHDELIVEAPEDEIKIATQILVDSMENTFALKVPLSVDAGTGANWYEAKGD